MNFVKRTRKFWCAPNLALTTQLVVTLLWISAEAQETSTSVQGIPGFNQNSMPTPMAMPSDVKTEVGGFARSEGTYYPSPIPSNSVLSQSLQLEANLLLDRESALTTSKVDVTLGSYVDWNSPYYSVQQLYGGMKVTDGDGQVSVGRRIEFWSSVDKDWQLGLWEPQFRLDPLQQVQQGLTGVFYQQSVTSSAGTVDWVVFGSPIFIPTQEPNIQEQNGSLVANSRWYQQPSPEGNALGKSTQFNYSLSVPDAGQLVSNPGGGMRLRWSENANPTGFWASANYAYKPVNALIVKYQPNLLATSNLLITGASTSVTIVPAVAYAHLLGGDLGYKSVSLGNFSLSYLEEDPIQQDPVNTDTSNWWQQQLGQLHIYSLHWDYAANDRWNFASDYLRVFQTITQDVDATGVAHTHILPFQTYYTNAISLKAKIFSFIAGKKLTTQFKATRDFDQNGNVYQTEFELAWTQRLSINTGVDVISPDDPSGANTDQSFINEFRANDRVYAGCSYVF